MRTTKQAKIWKFGQTKQLQKRNTSFGSICVRASFVQLLVKLRIANLQTGDVVARSRSGDVILKEHRSISQGGSLIVQCFLMIANPYRVAV